MKIQMKRFGFTLIELLVAIVIIGILATISTATFRSYFGRARDVERQSNVRNMATIVKVDQSDVSGTTKYVYDGGEGAGTLKDVLDANDFPTPTAEKDRCYYYGYNTDNTVIDGDGNNFVFFVVNDNASDYYADGTAELVNGIETAFATPANVTGIDCSSNKAALNTAASNPTNMTWLRIDGSEATVADRIQEVP